MELEGGQTTCDRNTALCTKVHRAVKKRALVTNVVRATNSGKAESGERGTTALQSTDGATFISLALRVGSDSDQSYCKRKML